MKLFGSTKIKITKKGNDENVPLFRNYRSRLSTL